MNRIMGFENCSTKNEFILTNEIVEIIKKTFNCSKDDIKNVELLKKGMTNKSFSFCINYDKFIMRIPGEGTDELINRDEEAQVYEKIKDLKLCDDLYFINAENGYKITKYIPDSRVCDCNNQDDLKKAMKRLYDFHKMNLKVDHEFDIFGKINFYESLWTSKSCYSDYQETKEKVFKLKSFIDNTKKDYCLTHIDAVPDNFLFCKVGNEEDIRLIDWEYAGMQDPQVDIAMFCIYALYDKKEQVDNIIDLYFMNTPDKKASIEERTKIYCYVSSCGFLWSNWCEYKKQLGIDFGDYALKQYDYAKTYYDYAMAEINKIGNKNE